MTAEDEQLASLIQRIARGDPQAITILHRLVHRRLMLHSIKYVRRKEMAEEAVQDGFVTIWRASADFDPARAAPLAWCYMIVRSRALDLLRHRHRNGRDLEEHLDEAPHEMSDPDASDPQDVVEHRQQVVALHEGLRRLECRQRIALSLTYFSGLSNTEISKQMQAPVGSVKTWIRQGRERLRCTIPVA